MNFRFLIYSSDRPATTIWGTNKLKNTVWPRSSSAFLRLLPTNRSTMASIEDPSYLGFDLSTQQLKAILIKDDLRVQHEVAVHFDRDLGAKYGVTNGAIKGPGEGEATSPVAMWIEAIDLLMERMKDSGVNFSSVSAISGASQVNHLAYEHIRQWLTPLNSNMGQSFGRGRQKFC